MSDESDERRELRGEKGEGRRERGKKERVMLMNR